MPKATLVPAFFSVNEKGETYGSAHVTLASALAVLRKSPNGTITVMLVTPACLRYLTDRDYDLDAALRDGMSDAEYIWATSLEGGREQPGRHARSHPVRPEDTTAPAGNPAKER